MRGEAFIPPKVIMNAISEDCRSNDYKRKPEELVLILGDANRLGAAGCSSPVASIRLP